MQSVDDAWDNFINNKEEPPINDEIEKLENNPKNNIPKCSDIYISTQTKIAYLNQVVNLNDVFWKIPVIGYHEACEGVIKKQMKVNCLTKDESKVLENKLSCTSGVVITDIIQQIDNPDARKVKYKDVRKINIGLCKKDLTSYRTKRKGAFYNCFVLIIRLKNGDTFKESHVKIFNTGKLEIPGIQQSSYLAKILDTLVFILQPYFELTLSWNNMLFMTHVHIRAFNVNFTIIKINQHRMEFVTVRKNAQKKVPEKEKISVLKYHL